jgi:hypothetical protein
MLTARIFALGASSAHVVVPVLAVRTASVHRDICYLALRAGPALPHGVAATGACRLITRVPLMEQLERK